MNKNVIYLFILILFTVTIATSAKEKQKPNVIIVLTDDQGYGEIAAHGNPHILTPHMDQLYHDGIRLDNFHVNSVCSPSRAALLTGRYASRTGVWHTLGSRNIMWQEEKTMADFFKSNGYVTMMSGKWHLGDNYPYRPEDKGFENVFRIGGGSLGQIGDYWGNGLWDAHYWDGTEWMPTDGYCTDVQFDAVFDFVRKNKNKPFFTYLATTAPHSPIGADDKYVNPYIRMGLKENVAKFYGMVTNIDENLGKLRQLLSELSITDNTILIFASDNGSACDKQGEPYNAGMRGHKGSCYDGGHRVPCFIYWPDGNLKGGLHITDATAHIDLLPTLLATCDIKNSFDVEFDGINLLPLLNNSENKWPKRNIVTETKVNGRSKLFKSSTVIANEWRLVQGSELYNISNDPSQKTDLADIENKQVELLQVSYTNWYKDVSARFNEKQHIPIGTNHETVLLTAMDVFPTKEGASAKTVWNQKGVAKAQMNHGVWAIDVMTEGDYCIELYRWAPELDLAFNKTLPKSKDVVFTEAGINIQDKDMNQAISGNEKYISFNVNLKKGQCLLDANLTTEKGKATSAYYVIIQKR
ncbi:arylsulfatase [Carboxylicivirga marina]|uniref:Arylsulfatase n=1 Tax=Carboxylicivirga marina TaxID=2800988 RepID=A0ABS1HIS6_9BACT|nr:arylsulfatase [Carboxylicivirga marina]MBK3517520.1 arylsulfatase [Carboxylicivirga marina]